MKTVVFINPMRTDRVTFICNRRGDVETFRCRETGICYQLEADSILDCYIIRNSGVEIGTRYSRRHALGLIEQTAALDFATAQADCGQFAIDAYIAF